MFIDMTELLWLLTSTPSAEATQNLLGNALILEIDAFSYSNVDLAVRLGHQHYLWKETLGYLLHPSIASDGPDLSIADIGTHNGYHFSFAC